MNVNTMRPEVDAPETPDQSITTSVAKRLAVLLICATTALLGLLASPAEASRPPTCVGADAYSYSGNSYARAFNNCSSSKRFFFEWDWGFDGDCSSLAAGRSRLEMRGFQATFAGFINC